MYDVTTIFDMTLSSKEKAVILVANAIAIYSISTENGSLPKNQSLFDFILKAIPKEIKPEISPELIDEVFVYVSNTHLELS